MATGTVGRVPASGPAGAGRGGPSSHLRARLRPVVDRIEAAVRARRAVDPSADQPFRGLYLSDQLIDALLADAVPGTAGGPDAGAVDRAGPPPVGEAPDDRLPRLARAC